MLMQIRGLERRLGGRTLFSGVDWQLDRRSRCGLVGANGVGKTSLLRLLAGEDNPDAGQIDRGSEVSLGYLPQEAPRQGDGPVLAYLLAAAADLRQLELRLRQTEGELARAAEAETAVDLAARYQELEAHYRVLGGYELPSRAQALLTGLGFSPTRQQSSVQALYGGWWMRLELARLLLQQPDLLLLDEPTNHLDLESMAWLEDFLVGYAGGWVTVSHDRTFLNRRVQTVAELTPSGLWCVPGNYDAYLTARALRAQQSEQALQRRSARRANVEAFAERFGAKATKARQAQSRLKQLARREATEPTLTLAPPAASLRLLLPQPVRSGDQVLVLEQLSFGYGAGPSLYRDVNLTLSRGERLALVGANGAGKSTLLKLMAGVLTPGSGSRRLGHQVTPYYFAQHQLEALDARRTVLEELQVLCPERSEGNLRNLLGGFLFAGDAVGRRVGVLSGGEKSRLALAKMLARPANLLLLDEPTNHLDLASREVLEAALAEFAGTLVLISHDRTCLSRVATGVLAVDVDGGLVRHSGDFATYEARLIAAARGGAGAAAAHAPGPTEVGVPSSAERAETQRERRQAQREAERQGRQLAALEAEVATAEAEVAALAAELAAPATYADHARFAALAHQHAEREAALKLLYDRWETLAG